MDVSRARDEGIISPTPTTESSPFNRSILTLLERIEYRRCESGEDIEAVRRLRYDSFVSSGLLGEGAEKSYDDGLDGAGDVYIFGVYFDEVLTSTLRIHHLTAETPIGPAMRMFPEKMAPYLERGESFVQPSLFASTADASSLALAMPYLTMRLTFVAESYFKSTKCVGVIRSEHAAFYHRIFEAEQVGEFTTFPYYGRKLGLFMADRATSYDRVGRRYPFLLSTPLEQRLLFGEQKQDGRFPLTVLPTARFVREAA